MPVLLRVSNARGIAPQALEITARWSPSQEVTRRKVQTANGLCLVHWRGTEERVDLVVADGETEVSLSMARDRRDAGRVLDLRLNASPDESGTRRAYLAPADDLGAVNA
jgi:hypothetical protein